MEVVNQLVSPSDCGSEGRGFDHPASPPNIPQKLEVLLCGKQEKTLPYVRFKMEVVAQLVRASDCGSEGRGFDYPASPAQYPAKIEVLLCGKQEKTLTFDPC